MRDSMRFFVLAGLVVALCGSAAAGAADPAERLRLPNSAGEATHGGPPGELVLDPSFEDGTPSTYWSESSTNFGSPLCTVAGCGTGTGTGPRTGDWWAWFGGTSAFEEGTMSQDIQLGSCVQELRFWLEVPVCNGATDYLEVEIDGTPVFTVDGTSPLCNLVGYTEQVVDISAWADGAVHTVAFHSITQNQAVSNFFVDDVSISDGIEGCALAIPAADRSGLVILSVLLIAAAALTFHRFRRA